MIKSLIKKYKSIILYVLFGAGTTIVNILSYWICSHLSHLGVVPSSVIAWFVAVLFAYLTNRKLVFNSRAYSRHEIIIEILSFYFMRFATGVVDWIGMSVFVVLMHFDDMIIKIMMNVIVIILNYIASKWMVFKKGNG